MTISWMAWTKPVAGLLNPRWLACLVALVVFFSPAEKEAGLPAAIDHAVLAVANAIQQPTLDGSTYVRISLNQTEMAAFMRDPVGSAQVVHLLAALEQSFTRSVIFVLPDVWPVRTQSEDFLSSLSATTLATDAALAAQVQTVRNGWNVLDHAAANTHYLFAIRQTVNEQPSSLLSLARLSVGGYGDWVDPTPLLPPAFSLTSQYVPAFANVTQRIPLFWQTPDGLKPDAVLALFMRQQGFRKVELPDAGTVQFDTGVSLPVSAQGLIYPRVDLKALDRAGVMQISLSTLLQQNVKRAVHDKHLVIGLEQDPAVDHLLTGLLSLNQGFYARLPNEYVYIQAAVLLGMVLLLQVVSFLSLRWNLLLWALVTVGLLLLPVAAMIGQGWWLPAGQWLCFWLAAGPVMMLWSLQAKHVDVAVHNWFSKQQENNAERAAPRNAATQLMPVQPSPIAVKKPLFSKSPRRALIHEQEPAMTSVAAMDDALMSSTGMAAETVHETREPENTLPVREAVEVREGKTTLRSLISSHHSATKPSIRKIGKYEIKRELGRGSMGVVYLAFDTVLCRKVALKVLHYSQFHQDDLPMMKERFFNEATTAAKLKHPNIVTIHDVGESRDMAFIAMDFVEGTTLSSYASKGKLLDVDTVYWIIAEVADALDYAHCSNFVHRDIKPSNILYDAESQEVKIADFGIVKKMDASQHRTGTGVSLGSPVYMSPEQVRGDKLTGTSDLFSLGVTFYQLLTGELPFKAENIAALTQLILQCKFTPVDEIRPDLPPSARRIINKVMQKNPANRYANGTELAAAIDQARQREFSR